MDIQIGSRNGAGLRLRWLACGTALAAFFTWTPGALAQPSDQPPADPPATAQSEEDEERTDVVRVTARKREEVLSEVPMAASVLDAQSIADRGGINDTGGIVSQTPGARFNDLAYSTLSEVSLRASGTARGTNAETGVGLYANGVYVGGGLQFSRNYTRVDFFDLERAEVLRGTLGALYGRNAVGGAVNLIAQKPLFENSGRAMIDYGFDTDRTLVQTVANFRASDTVAFRFGVEYASQGGGNFHNTSLDRYTDELDGWIQRASVRIAKDDFDATLMMQNMDMTIGGGAAVLTIPAGTGCPATAASLCYLQAYRQDRYAFPHNTLDDISQSVQQAVLDVSYDFGWAELQSVSSYRRRHTIFISDNDFLDAAELARMRAAGIVSGGANVRTDLYQNLWDISQTMYEDLHLGGTLNGVDWMVGLEYLSIESDYETNTITNGATGAGQLGVNDLTYDSIATYASVGFNVTENLNLSGELRYTKDDKDFSSIRYSLPAITPVEMLRQYALDADNVSHNLVARYIFDASWMVYGKVGSGYRAGGFNSGVNPPPPAIPPRPVEPTFNAEDSVTWEFGAKGNVTDDFYVTFAGYSTQVSDSISQVDTGCFVGLPACNTRPTNFAINAGEANLAGVEAEAVYTFGSRGDIRGSLRGTLSRQWGEFEGGPYDGFEVPQKPDWAASANFNMVVPFPGFAGVFNVNYRGQRGGVESVAAGTGVPVALSEFDILDLRTGIRFDETEIAFYVNNLTDEQFTLLDSPTSERWSAPRTAGVQVRFGW